MLQSEPGPGARLLALAHLENVDSAARAIDEGKPAALHDFRVAIRRLRITLRTFRPELKGSIRGRDRKALRRLSRITNQHQDLEAQLPVLDRFEATPAVTAVRAHVSVMIAAEPDPGKEVVKAFRSLEGRLSRKLRNYCARLDPDDLSIPVRFQARIAARGIELVNEAMDCLATIESDADAATMHKARLHLKRLRYTIEPLRPFNLTVVDVSTRLTRAQDLLGDLRDRARLLGAVEAMRVLPGANEELLNEFVTSVQQQAAEVRSELQRLWFSGNSKWFFQRLIHTLDLIARAEAAPTVRRLKSRAGGNLWRDPSST